MTIPQTETTNMKVWQENVWKITPYNFPAIVVDPPGTKELTEPQDLAEDVEDIKDALETKLRYDKGGLTELTPYRAYREEKLRREQ